VFLFPVKLVRPGRSDQRCDNLFFWFPQMFADQEDADQRRSAVFNLRKSAGNILKLFFF
jgi:hypothetical protein